MKFIWGSFTWMSEQGVDGHWLERGQKGGIENANTTVLSAFKVAVWRFPLAVRVG